MLHENGGDITTSLFPADDTPTLKAYLSKKLDEGYTRALAVVPGLSVPNRDACAIAWAYSRAFLAVWLRLSATPSEIGVQGESTTKRTDAQIATFKEFADSYLARHEQFIPSAVGEASGNTIIVGVPVRYRLA